MYPFAKEEKTPPHIGPLNVIPRFKYEGKYKKSFDIADFYGFSIFPPYKIEKQDREHKGPADKIAFMRNFIEHGLDACTPPVKLAHTVSLPYSKEIKLRLDIVGTEESLAEAYLIHTAKVILKEHGIEDILVSINSVGGVNSSLDFVKEFITYCRKNIDAFDTHCRQALKNDPLDIFDCENESCREVLNEAPSSISFLSEKSRRHFYKVLEALETFNTAYEIDNCLVGDKSSATHTVFQIKDKKSDKVYIHGERYDRLSRHAQMGRTIPVVGITFVNDHTNTRKTAEKVREYKKELEKPPLVYIVEIGEGAHHQSFLALELLRNANIPTALSLVPLTIREQFARAKELDTPTLVIIGHKETVEGTAIVRNQKTMWQTSVPREHLVKTIKTMI